MEEIKKAIEFKADVWGHQAKAAPDGPTYDNMAGYLPPLQYVNTPFRHYPIVLSLKDGTEKIRYVSDGSRIEVGISAKRVVSGVWYGGERALSIEVEASDPFGGDEARLIPAAYRDGYLPIVRVGYKAAGNLYRQECFAAPAEEGRGLAAFLKLSSDRPGRVSLSLDDTAPEGNTLRDGNGRIAAILSRPPDSTGEGKLSFRVGPHRPLFVLLPNAPLDASADTRLSTARYDNTLKWLAAYWRGILAQGSAFDVPEKRVMDAWRAMAIGSFMLSYGDTLCYSAQNFYQTQFEAESGDAVMALALLGHLESTLPYADRLLQFPRSESGIGSHNAAFRLFLAMRHWLLIRDLSLVRKHFDLLRSEADFLLANRDAAHGLIREGYAGDTRGDLVYPLHTNAMAWRAIRDFAVLCRQLGRDEMAKHYAESAEVFADSVRAAIAGSMRKDLKPPFLPGALISDEKAYDTLTESIRASYYNLVVWYFLHSELYGPFDEPVDALIRYAQRHGGFLLGLVRFDQHSDLYTGGGFDDLYGLPYMIELLRRGEIDDFLVSFYGKLAHGMTRDTFINAEVTGWYPIPGETGRRLYLPPNSSANAAFLIPFRHMLLMETDANRDGLPDALRLLSGAPRPWLADGKSITFRDAPTAFGPVSVKVRSLLSVGELTAECRLPERESPRSITLTLRLPQGKGIASVAVNGKPYSRFDAVKETIDLSGLSGRVVVRVGVK
ncbi:MAG: hypothetical protein IT210_05820 [Armatimonadetes bacterium]|nr:hypothetical protein [Armatimonadota bacterium]